MCKGGEWGIGGRVAGVWWGIEVFGGPAEVVGGLGYVVYVGAPPESNFKLLFSGSTQLCRRNVSTFVSVCLSQVES